MMICSDAHQRGLRHGSTRISHSAPFYGTHISTDPSGMDIHPDGLAMSTSATTLVPIAIAQHHLPDGNRPAHLVVVRRIARLHVQARRSVALVQNKVHVKVQELVINTVSLVGRNGRSPRTTTAILAGKSIVMTCGCVPSDCQYDSSSPSRNRSTPKPCACPTIVNESCRRAHGCARQAHRL